MIKRDAFRRLLSATDAGLCLNDHLESRLAISEASVRPGAEGLGISVEKVKQVVID